MRAAKPDTRFRPGQSGNRDTQFKPGISGNPAGRPLGARSRLTEDFLAGVCAAWEKHGPACLDWLAQNDKAAFVHMVASLMPRNAKLDVDVAQKPIYFISDNPLSPEEWEAKFCGPSDEPN